MFWRLFGNGPTLMFMSQLKEWIWKHLSFPELISEGNCFDAKIRNYIQQFQKGWRIQSWWSIVKVQDASNLRDWKFGDGIKGATQRNGETAQWPLLRRLLNLINSAMTLIAPFIDSINGAMKLKTEKCWSSLRLLTKIIRALGLNT